MSFQLFIVSYFPGSYILRNIFLFIFIIKGYICIMGDSMKYKMKFYHACRDKNETHFKFPFYLDVKARSMKNINKVSRYHV